ncbi:hypothetical protein AK812_SmicGene3911 [Symbiodinium microadriaticum]|uniref:Uncharacterized protein n=1 Tax=Symbiodinium microadriaticum TaxID=2951 RepID=A0A1Q9EXP6_SYMMI|nr:hypothetical protein AK812_SmicGene3911 [Symbiodinium microadriaticum]CAE7871297.1 unnamed protein product [Symbiodinium microadriaticum]CAE7946781.1 unnamed protein product [Symbiodinium sp. KB8]
MGKQGRGSYQGQWSDAAWQSSPAWSVWPGAWPKKGQRDGGAKGQGKHRFPSYDADWEEQGAHITVLEERRMQPAATPTLSNVVQQTVNASRKAEQRVAKLKKAITSKEEKWRAYQIAMKAAYNREQQRCEKDQQRLQAELASAMQEEEEAHQLLATAAAEYAKMGKDTPSGDSEWEQFLGRSSAPAENSVQSLSRQLEEAIQRRMQTVDGHQQGSRPAPGLHRPEGHVTTTSAPNPPVPPPTYDTRHFMRRCQREGHILPARWWTRGLLPYIRVNGALAMLASLLHKFHQEQEFSLKYDDASGEEHEASQLCLGSETCADSELLVGLDGLNSIGLGVAYWNWSVPVPARVLDHPDIPVPPHAEELPDDSDRPVYPDYVHDRVTYGECLAVGRRHDIEVVSSNFSLLARQQNGGARYTSGDATGDVPACMLQPPARPYQLLPGGCQRLEDLRSVTIALGGAWPFHSPFNGRVPGTLRDSEEEDSAPHPHLCWVQVLVLKCLYVPEKLSVAIGLPATPLEATTVIQGARPLTLSRDFPHLIAAAPQPFSEACVYIANPSWYGFDMVACADLTCIDGRIFAVRLPDYADRRVVLAHVDLPPGSHITVYVGFLEAPLQDGVPLHLFPGVTLRFLPDDQPPAPALAISEMLQSMAFLNTEGVNPEVAPADYYCLVLRYSYKLFRADNLLPWQYRERFAGAIGCTASQVSIFPATPRAIDVAIEGCPCRTALAVVPTSFVTEEVNSYCFLVDARPILQGWMCFRTRTSPIGAALVLRELNAEAPLGLRATLDDVATLDALIDVGPGQILVARYIPLEDLPNLGDPVGHPGEVEWELLPPIHPTDESSDDSNPPQEESMEGNYQVLVPCMLFMTDYCPELYEVALYLPAEPDELVDGVLDARSQQRQENSPCPHFVRPQPDTAFASLLMLPLWPVEHCVVLVDGRTVDQRLFAICLAPLIDRRSLLIAAAYEPDQPLDVYVRDSPWPLRADTAIPLYTGDLVVVTFSTQLAPGTGHLIQMLGSPDSWDSAAVPVEPTVRFTLILQESDSFLIANHSHELDGVESSDSVDSIDARTAEHLGIDEGDLILYAAFPGVDDHWERGRPVDRVLIAIRHPQGLAGTDTRTACVIDARPIFMGIQGSALSGRVLDCSTLIDRLVHFCPVGFVVTITGGASGIALPNGLREVQNGTVLSVHFRAMDTAIVSSYDAADASPTTDGPPSRNRASALPLVLFAPGADWLDVSLGRGQRRRHTCGSCRLLPSREPMRTCLVSAAAFMQFNLSMASKQSDLYCSSMWAASPCHDVYCIRPWCLTSAVVSLSAAFLRALIGAGTLWGFLGLLSLVWILISRAQQHGRKPSGCAKTVPAASPPSRSDNRQRRSRHNGPSHWQGPPQGHGAGSGAPSPSDTNEDPDPANQVHTIDPPHVSTETGFGTRVPFLIYSHEYGPEQVVARLVLPARVREAWAALEQRRTASAQRRSPRLIPVFPQPRDGVACVLALPHWDFEGVPVLVDCHVAPAKLFCALLPGWILRESFLQYLGIPIDLPCHVFLRDIPWPLQAGAYLFPQSGDLVTVHIPPAAPGPPVELSQLLEPDHVWDFTFDPPGNSGDINWVLSDGIHVALPLLGDSFALSSAHTAEALGLEAGQFTLVPALPAIEDHARLGINSQRVFAACRTDSSSDGSRVPYILDQRPILLHMYMALATDGILDVGNSQTTMATIIAVSHQALSSQSSSTPTIYERSFLPLIQNLLLWMLSLLTVLLIPTDGDTMLDIPVCPLRMEEQVVPAKPLPLPQLQLLLHFPSLRLLCKTEMRQLIGHILPSLSGNKFCGVWFAPSPVGFSCCSPSCLVRLSVLLFHELSSQIASFGGDLPAQLMAYVNRRLHFVQKFQVPLALVTGLSLPPVEADKDLASCLNLRHRHQADGCSPDIGDATGPTDQALDLRLFDYLPSAITVDLSHVSLPLQQSIDQVLQWTFQGSWALTSALPADIQLHPAARRLLALCPPGELERQERISIFTDGSYGKGCPANELADSLAKYAGWRQNAIKLWAYLALTFRVLPPNRIYDIAWANSAETQKSFCLVPPSGSWVDYTLDWGQPRVDHFGICLDVFFHVRVGTQNRQISSNLDREAMASVEGQQILRQICSTIPLQPWATDVHRHYLAIEKYLSQALAVSFPSKRGVCRSSHFSAATWDLRQKRVWLRKQVAWERTHSNLVEAQAALYSWRHGQRLIVGRVTTLFPCIAALRRQHGLVADLQTTRRSLRQSIRRDVSLRIQATAAEAAALPCADVVARLRPLLGPSKRRVKQRKALLSVCHPDGQPAQSATEVEDIWIGHFGSIEDGARVDPVSFVRDIQQKQNSRDLDCYSLDASTVPSRIELEQALRQTQTGRAVGLDHVPGELLHFAASSASRALYQLFIKTALRASEPIQFKGGALHAVWKGKSSPAFCSSHRGILVSSTVGKAFHRIARSRAVPALRNVATEMQIGGLPTFPVVLASHFVRLFQSGARDRQHSHGLMFLDLREAFYRVVRPLLVGSECSDEQIAAAVKAMQLPAGVMHELHAHIKQSSAARDAGASDWADLAITDALTGTWFRFQSGQQVVQTGIGSRPGDNLADICFSFIFAKVLRSVQESLSQYDLTPVLPWSQDMPGSVLPVAADVGCSIPALDATWMDDATFLVRSPTSHALPTVMATTGAAVVDACVGRALLPNLDKGKTEFIACPLGPGSRQVRKDLFADRDPSIRLGSRLWQDSRVSLVSSYRHLGGIIHHDSSLIRELKQRAALAWKAFNTRKRQIFGSPRVSRKDKVVLFESLVLSILLYGAGSWDQLSTREESILASAYHGMCFHMLRPAFSYDEALHLGGSRVLALLELPSISTLLHVARLRHLLSVVRTAVPVMWAMLHWQGRWLGSVRSSLNWLWSCIDGGSQFQSWETAWTQWKGVCHDRPKLWKGWIRKAQAQATLQEAWLGAETHHLGLLARQLRIAGAKLPALPQSSGPVRHCCAPCQQTFATHQAWSVHAFKRHGIVGEYRHVLSGTQCQACLRHFTTHIKLCRHLQHFSSCRRSLQARGFRCVPEPGIGNRNAVDEGKFQAPSLQAQGPMPLPEVGDWDDYLDRPSIEVLECLTHITHGLQPEDIKHDLVWERARIAFSSVCLPNKKIVATALQWESILVALPEPVSGSACPLLAVARWIMTEDPVDWLVPNPVDRHAPVATFRDARQTLAHLDLSPLRFPSGDEWDRPFAIRVGPGDWLSRHSRDMASSIDFSHEECLDLIGCGAVPSFFEDVSEGVVFILSTLGLPHWSEMPVLPVRRRSILAQLQKATFASDLVRFALRLWLWGVPTAFLCPAGYSCFPESFSGLSGLACSRLGDAEVWRSANFDWEPFCFTLSN